MLNNAIVMLGDGVSCLRLGICALPLSGTGKCGPLTERFAVTTRLSVKRLNSCSIIDPSCLLLQDCSHRSRHHSSRFGCVLALEVI